MALNTGRVTLEWNVFVWGSFTVQTSYWSSGSPVIVPFSAPADSRDPPILSSRRVGSLTVLSFSNNFGPASLMSATRGSLVSQFSGLKRGRAGGALIILHLKWFGSPIFSHL